MSDSGKNMVGSEQPNRKVRSGMGSHEEFLELCALSASGELNATEQKKLREHLTLCSACREAITEFETVVDQAVPALAADFSHGIENPSFSQEAAEASFWKRLSEEQVKSASTVKNEGPWLFPPLAVRRSREFRRNFDRYYFWIPAAAGLLLCTSLGILAYRMGKRQGIDVAQIDQTVKQPSAAAGGEALAAAIRERDATKVQLSERGKTILELRREIVGKTNENAKLSATRSQQQLALEASGKDKNQLTEERDRFMKEAAADNAALEASERKLGILERDRREDAIRAASLEAQVAKLSRALEEQENTTSEQAQLLEKDRDIRELMGARDLYVAEVRDIGGNGKAEKAIGRVFYTKGKSLIFYAYDLNERPGVKEANTFEAWGRRGPDWTQAFKLGIFYQDNAAKKRWVMKFNDKKTLDEIDAVFVTVEPHGGSEKPTGKPLLFAYLKVTPNHP